MLQSVVVYFSLALFMIICGYIAAKRERIFQKYHNVSEEQSFWHYETIWPLLLFALIFGCRYNVGVDYPAYLKSYLYGGGREYEFLFQGVTDFMSRSDIHYAFYFFLWAFLEVFLLFYSFRKQRFLFPYMAFILIFGFYFMSMMNVIRQQIAACIFLFSLQYIERKQALKYYVCVLLAMGFHKSAILLLPVYPLFRWRKDWFPSRFWQWAFYVVAILLSTQYDAVVRGIEGLFVSFANVAGYGNYATGILYNETLNSANQFGNNTGFGFYISVFLSAPIIYLSNRLKDFYRGNIFRIIYSLWFVRILADFVVGDSIILNRPFVYVYDIKIVMLAYFLHYCFNSKRVLFLLLGSAFVLVHIAMLLNLLSNGDINTSKFFFFWQ